MAPFEKVEIEVVKEPKNATRVRDRYYAAAVKAATILKLLATAPLASDRFKGAAAGALILELELTIEHASAARKKALTKILLKKRKALAKRAAALAHLEDPYLSITCQCGAKCKEVRPGKWQCPKCE